MEKKGITRVLRRMRSVVGLSLVLGGGVLAATAVPSVGAGHSVFPDMRGSYHEGACVGGTLAQCEASPQYPSTFTISTEDFTTGNVVLAGGGTGTISGCTITTGPPITSATPTNPYQSQAHYNISADTNQLTGTFDDSYGRRAQPTFANRDAAGPDTCPTGNTGTTTTGTTTTTTTSQLSPTVSQVMCNYFVATNGDVCTATVADATGSGMTPTGNVVFTGDRTGQCSLVATPLSPGVASCSITVLGTENFLNVTATYQGDSMQAGSSGTTKFLSASTGNGLYNPTIQPFNPNSINLLDNNPDPGATVTGQLELTDGASTDCPGKTAAQTAQLRAAGRSTAAVATLTASTTLRHVRRGKFRLHLTLNPAKARKLFRTTQTLMLIVRVTVRPRHGKALVGTTLQSVRLKFTKHGVLVVHATARSAVTKPGASVVGAIAADQPRCLPSATITFSHTRGVQGTGPKATGWYGTLNMTMVIPAGTPGPERDTATVATLTGSLTFFCNVIGKTRPVTVSETITGGTSTNSSPNGISYTYGINPTTQLRAVSVSGILPPPPGDPADQCPAVNLSAQLQQTSITTGPAPTTSP